MIDMEEIPDKVYDKSVTPQSLIDRLNALYAEVHADTEDIKNEKNLTSATIDRYLTTWETIRSEIFIMRVNLIRAWLEKKTQLDDDMRVSLSSRTQSGFTRQLGALDSSRMEGTRWEERLAKYETDNIALIKVVRLLEKLKQEHDSFLEFMKYKDIWLRGILSGVRDKERNFTYSTKKTY